MDIGIGIDLGPPSGADSRARLEAGNVDRLVIRSRRSGCLAILGLGIVAAAAVPQLDWLVGRLTWWNVPLGAILGIVGGFLLAARSWSVLDRGRGVVEEGFSILRSTSTSERPLGDYERVVLAERLDSSTDSDGHTSYTTTFTLGLEGGRDSEPLSLAAAGVWESSLGQAEIVSRFLDLPFVDRAAERTQAPHELDLSLRDQIGPAKRRRSPPRPSQPRSRLTAGPEGTLAIDIPLPDPRPWIGITLFVLLLWCLPVGLLSRSLLPTFTPLAVVVLSGLKCALGFRSRVEVARERLWVRTEGLFVYRELDIPTAELEDLAVRSFEWGGPRSTLAHMMDGVLIARSDRRSVRFGHGLSRQELDWLRFKIFEVVTAPLDGERSPAVDRQRLPALETAPSTRTRWIAAPLGWAAGTLASAVLGGPLAGSVEFPFLEHLLTLGGALGLALGLVVVARRPAARRPALSLIGLLAVAVALFAAAGWLQPSLSLDELAMARRKPRSGALWAGWIPVAAVLDVAAADVALRVATWLRRRRNRPAAS